MVTKSHRHSAGCSADIPGTGDRRREGNGRRSAASFPSDGGIVQSATSNAARLEVARNSTVSFGFLQALSEAVEQSGVSREKLLSAAGFSAEQPYAVEDRLSRAEAYRVCELALDLTHDPALGLHWGEKHTSNAFGPFSHLIAHAPSLRHGLKSLSEYNQLIGDDCSYRLLEHDGIVKIVCLPLSGASLRVQRFVFELTAVGFYRLVRSFSPHTRPIRVAFSFDAPAFYHEYSRIFDHEVLFNQPSTEIAFDAALLDTPSPYKDAGMHDALRALVERRIARFKPQAPFSQRVREVLVQQARLQRVDMGLVARSLGLSVRSLRRRLTSECKSYHEIERDALAAVAMDMLRNGRMTIQEVAYQMGFSSSTAFHHAFKRWTGMTPTAFRKAGIR
jgi:AraC-like DNA-binding protein